MFYYYGRKQRIVAKYPKPIYDTIIEPFAGSAAYAMNYHERNVILIEKDKKIADTWHYLIKAFPEDILDLPLLEKGQCLNDPEFDDLLDEEKHVIGFFLNPGSAVPKKSPGNFCGWNEKNRLRLSEDVTKVTHWQIIHGDYTEIPKNNEATYFIDPPYQGNGGKYYRHGNKGFDYDSLRQWIETLHGQIIVCENSEADWMDFQPLVEIKGQRHKTKEVIWYRE